MNEFTKQASNNAASMRVCQICLEPIVELKKASYIQAGAGVRITVHDACLEGVIDALTKQQERERLHDALLEEARTMKKSVSQAELDRKLEDMLVAGMTPIRKHL